LPSPETRIRIEQIDAIFDAITVSVGGGALAASILAASLLHLGAAETRIAIAWASYIILCAAAHILLCHAYRRSRPVGDRWRLWARWFSLFSFVEGAGWGWASFGLVTAGHSEAQYLVFLIAGGVAAATVPGFSPYFPAFFAVYVPLALATMAAAVTSADPAAQAAFPLMLVFVGATGGVALKTNKAFKQHIRLRIQTEELAADLLRQKELAEQANLAKSTFLAAASHDLRQPVHALGLLAGALRGVPMPLEGTRLLDQIEASTNAMDGLFTALLDISRLDAGVVEIQRQCFVLEPLLDRICRDYAGEANAKGLSLILKRSTVIVDTDPVLIERILRNLISNAVRYTDRGRIVAGCRRRGAAVSIQVWDTGRGIPADQQDKIFQEYYQLGNPERDRAKGLGLGLAIVRRMTGLLGCELTLRSEPGRGTCFEVVVPIAERAELAKAKPEESSGALARGLIVVIDDELAIREAMSSLLTKWGHDVVTGGSGDEAIARLSTYAVRPDLVICDYRLRNGENGISVIERLRSDYNENIPAMLITGDTAPDRLAEAQASGLLLLHKPVSNSKLRAAIVRLIAQAEVKAESGEPEAEALTVR